MRRFLLSLLLAASLRGAEPMCGTAPWNDERVHAIHQRTRARIAANEIVPARSATLREGAFHVRTDETITPGYHPFDLDGQTLVFTPEGDAAFTMRRESLRSVEPAGDPVRDFQNAGNAPDWHYVAHDLPFAFPLFGHDVTRIYVSAFNGITTSVPPLQRGTQFDAIQAAVHRGPLLSPLMITTNKPRFLEYPRVWIDDQPGAVIVTWRSSANAPFGYDVQATLAGDGSVSYSYRAVTAMRWGAPILTPGLDPLQVVREELGGADDEADDVSQPVPAAVRPMLDVRRVAVQRLAQSDLFAIRVTLGAGIDRTKLADGEVLGFEARLRGVETAVVEIGRTTTRVFSFGGLRFDADGASVNIDGNGIEFYGIQGETDERSVRVASYYEPLGRTTDSLSTNIAFPAAPRSIVADLSSVAQNARVDVPIVEPFVLGTLDPRQVWDVVQTAYGVSAHDVDAVAIYQSFYTDIVLYAGGYAVGGNPQVNGIAPFAPFYGAHASRSPTLLHLNQLTYNYGLAEATASKLMLHEFGHRWLYFFSIAAGAASPRVLNPVSAHPAAYVHTPSAFPVYGEDESSVMGGAFFTPLPDGSYRAHAANMGYSWTDLYLMGLAAPAEVPPWFYLAGTTLPLEYWPAEGAIATGEKREVNLGQVTAVHGSRVPSSALSQRQFRVLFVLVTESDADATDAEVAKLNEWRALMERNFTLATGGRGRVVTTFVRPARRRSL